MSRIVTLSDEAALMLRTMVKERIRIQRKFSDSNSPYVNNILRHAVKNSNEEIRKLTEILEILS